MRLILDSDPRMARAAAWAVMPRLSLSRRSWVPKQDAQHGRPLCRLGHDPSRIFVRRRIVSRNCAAKRCHLSFVIAMVSYLGLHATPNIGYFSESSWTLLSPDRCVWLRTLLTGYAGADSRWLLGLLARGGWVRRL